MKFYNYDEIKAAADCAAFARDVLGLKLNNDNRCAATWRNGDNPTSVHITPEGWHDFGSEESGSVIDLCAILKFGGDLQQAQEFLGEHYHLKPHMLTQEGPLSSGKYDSLIKDGYKEVARYGYRDVENNLIHFTSRLEHPEKGKTFIQGTPHGWGLGDVDPILYNLAALTVASWCCIVEGEKDADRLISLNIPATTCAQGAKKWHRGYAKHFEGMHVAILPDNDEAGQQHARIIAASLADVAKEIRIVKTSDAPKGDVSDYLDEGHTGDDVLALISDAMPIDPEDVLEIDVPDKEEDAAIRDAKQANSIPFRNYIPTKTEKPPRHPNAKPVTEVTKSPRTMNQMVDDLHLRFLGFPRKVGEQLFDHDRDSTEIYYMHRAADLFSWVGRKSKKPVEWGRGDALADKADFYSAVQAEAIRYESISSVPDWPKRSDVYYVHPKIPRPSPDTEYLWRLVEFFKPATKYDQRLFMAMLIAPLWYIPRTPRPSWIIDSEDGQGTGKSTAVEAAAFLYGTEAVRTCPAELQYGTQEITKRLLCAKGRNARILLIDNVTGTFTSPVLADLITSWTISGKRPYGTGEETRPNNLTYVITANNATVDTDIASRSYYIFVKKPTFSPTWKEQITKYIEKNRYRIIADIIGLLENHKPFEGMMPRTRFPEFEQSILQAVCETPEMYQETLEHLEACRTDSNIEEEQARGIEDMFRGQLANLGINPDEESVWIQTPVVNSWGRKALQDGHDYPGQPIQLVRSLAKQRLLKMVNPRVKRWPHNGNNKTSGAMWNPYVEHVSWNISRNADGVPTKTLAEL